jgi:glycosyltransferase involved in cell wall biosynthesis
MQSEPAQPLCILYAGRLIAMKGIQDLLDACALLGEPFTLTLVGDGPERRALEQQAAERGVPAIFLGARPPLEVADLMRASDVLVLPSHTIPGKWKEQFGRVLVEAMACGCVPVGSDSGAIPSVVGDGGLIYPEGDVAALAQRLISVAGDRDLLERLRVRALERARQRYSWRAVAEVLWSTLRHVMELSQRSATA